MSSNVDTALLRITKKQALPSRAGDRHRGASETSKGAGISAWHIRKMSTPMAPSYRDESHKSSSQLGTNRDVDVVHVGGDGRSSVGLFGLPGGGSSDGRYEKKLFKIEMTTATKGAAGKNEQLSNSGKEWKKSSNQRSTNYDDRATTPLQPHNRKRVQSIFTQSVQMPKVME